MLLLSRQTSFILSCLQHFLSPYIKQSWYFSTPSEIFRGTTKLCLIKFKPNSLYSSNYLCVSRDGLVKKDAAINKKANLPYYLLYGRSSSLQPISKWRRGFRTKRFRPMSHKEELVWVTQLRSSRTNGSFWGQYGGPDWK